MMEQLPRWRFRQAAKRLHPTAKISEQAHVHQMADGGAFVEMTVWVSLEEAQREPVGETEPVGDKGVV